MCGFMNAKNYDMARNGERWLIKQCGSSLAARSIIDVGANRGDWSALVLEAAPTSKVYAVEMIQSFASDLRRRFGETATIVESALSDRREHVAGYRVGGGGRIPRGFGSDKQERRVELHTRTGDDLARELGLTDVSLIMIDVDGHDIKVLRWPFFHFGRTTADSTVRI